MKSESIPGNLRLDDVRVLVLFGGQKFFGSERANLEVFRCLAGIGLQARFITSSRWGRAEIEPALDALGFSWVQAPYGFHWGRYLLGWKCYYLLFNLGGLLLTSWRVWREARYWRATHLYVGNWEYASYALPALLWLRLPLVYRAGDELPTHTWFHRWLTRRLVGRAGKVVCVSEFIRKSCVTAGVPRERTQVIYSYPPARENSSEVSVPQLPAGALVIGYVGQIAEHKGVVVLLDAVEEMLRRGDNIVLLLAGEPSWGDALLVQLKQRIATGSWGARIIFLGYVQEVFAFMQRCEVHVCPSLYSEALANVVLEAKLCSRPSIVFPTGGLPEVIEHGVDGFVCKNWSAAALREAFEYYLADPLRLKAAGEAARQSLEERFGQDRYRAEWHAVFSGNSG